jgi:urease accessory protein
VSDDPTDSGGDDATLEAFRLADSFLPVGTYTVSYGLEQFVQDDRVADADDLESLLATYLRQQVGPAELVALRVAHTAAQAGDVDAVCEADRRLTAVTMAAEFRESAEQSGDRLLSLQQELREEVLLDRYAALVDEDDTPGNYPVVLGVATGLAGVDQRTACLLCCHGFVTGLLGAAQRLLSLGHTDAQRILDDLRPVMVAAVEDSDGRPLDSMSPFAPLVDVLAADHERAERRLFVS